jgi:diguanylate cyclase (GGDEF)-like protein/PAS domain S-box-containing protein
MSDGSKALWEAVDHEECDTMSIHAPGAIQSCGWLLAFDLAGRCVSHLSSNLGEPIAGILGTPTVLGSTVDEVARVIDLPGAVLRFEAIDGWRAELPWLASDPVVVTSHSTSEHYILEIERDVPALAPDPTAMIAPLLAASNWQTFAEEMVKALGQLFGYSRTMAYTFHPDNHGEVIAEYLNQPDLEPFLGLHYPAADIPAPARRLYALQDVRFIENVDGPTVDLLGATAGDGQVPTLDLSFARRRAAAPVHLQYMRNMGVAATATVSVVQLERLTGMFVMHHTEPRSLSLSDCQTLSTLSRLASFVAVTMDQKSFETRRARVAALAEKLRRNLSASSDAIRFIEAIGDDLLSAVQADGLVARIGGELLRLGDVPDQFAIDRRARELRSAGTKLIAATDCLAADMPELAMSDRCAGAILARLPGTPEAYLAWFRRPFLTTVRWGGELTAQVRKDELGRLHPRSSFDEFVEDVTDRSRTWSDPDRLVVDSLLDAVQSGLLEWSYRQLAFQASIGSDDIFEAVFADAPIGIALLGLDGRFQRVNRALCGITGYDEQELTALTFQDITHPDDLDMDLNEATRLLNGEITSYQMDKRYFAKDGHLIWVHLSGSIVRDADRQPLIFIAHIEDISVRKRDEELLRRQATRDSLTGVFNRSRFEEELARYQTLARRHGYEEEAAVLMIDLDGLKQVNDEDGHLAGDDYLKSVAETISRRLRLSDVFARIGGDEFAALLPHTSAAQAQKLARTLADQVATNSHGSVCIGIGMLTRGQPDDALQRADQAMYHAKRQGRGNIYGP